MAQVVVESLAARHEVTILCGRPSYDPTARRGWSIYQSERMGRAGVIRVGSTDYPRTQMKKRILNYLSYTFLAMPRALVFPCDVILSMTDPPFEGIAGAFVALVKNKPYVYNIRDLYPDMAVGGTIVEPGRLAGVWEKMHRWAMRRATKVIVLGEDMRNRILAKGIDPARVVVIRDGAEISPRQDGAADLDPKVIRAVRGDFKFVLLHAGNLGFYGAWETLLDGARHLAAEGVGLIFVGEGAQREKLIADASGIPNVRFLPFFPANEIPSVLAAPDAHVITVKRGLEGVVVPSKLYGILAARKPIVAVAPEECDVVSIGREKGFSISADPDNPAQFVERVREILRDPERVRKMGEAAGDAAFNYERTRELQKLVAVVEESDARKGGARKA